MVHLVVARIPPGKVVAYGEVARRAGHPGRARWVGKILSQLPPDTELPWHRVINAAGGITCPRANEARDRLVAEGVEVRDLKVNINKYGWR
jgi:methylated-DNA-protein-cysteine methyltransferase-like protein